MSAPTLTVAMTPRLDSALREVIRAHRRAGREENMSTAEAITVALRYEQNLEDDTLAKLHLALANNQPETVDLRIIDGMDRLKKVVAEHNGGHRE